MPNFNKIFSNTVESVGNFVAPEMVKARKLGVKAKDQFKIAAETLADGGLIKRDVIENISGSRELKEALGNEIGSKMKHTTDLDKSILNADIDDIMKGKGSLDSMLEDAYRSGDFSEVSRQLNMTEAKTKRMNQLNKDDIINEEIRKRAGAELDGYDAEIAKQRGFNAASEKTLAEKANDPNFEAIKKVEMSNQANNNKIIQEQEAKKLQRETELRNDISGSMNIANKYDTASIENTRKSIDSYKAGNSTLDELKASMDNSGISEFSNSINSSFGSTVYGDGAKGSLESLRTQANALDLKTASLNENWIGRGLESTYFKDNGKFRPGQVVKQVAALNAGKDAINLVMGNRDMERDTNGAEDVPFVPFI